MYSDQGIQNKIEKTVCLLFKFDGMVVTTVFVVIERIDFEAITVQFLIQFSNRDEDIEGRRLTTSGR